LLYSRLGCIDRKKEKKKLFFIAITGNLEA